MKYFKLYESISDTSKKNTIEFNPAKVLVLTFAAIILAGSFLLSLSYSAKNETLSYIDALFTSTSAVCVTGLVVKDTFDTFTLFGQLIIMLLIQIGGLGVMSFAILIISMLGKKISFHQKLLLQEDLNQYSIQGIIHLVKFIIFITFALECMGAIILGIHWFPEMGFKSFYFGLFHAVSAFNNAGFDLMGDYTSLTYYQGDLLTNLVIMTLIILGGIGFFVLWNFYSYIKTKKLFYHTKLVILTTGLLLLISFFILFLIEYNNPDTLGEKSIGEKICNAIFMAVTPRTAGFSVIAIDKMRQASLYFLIILMFIGASPGSTGGGIKTTTFAVILISTIGFIKKRQNVIFERKISREIYFKSCVILFLSLVLVSLGTFALLITESGRLFEMLFEVVSAFGTVGLSTGITPDLSTFGKFILILIMFIGRVGPLIFVYILGQQGKPDLLDYPEGNIMIG